MESIWVAAECKIRQCAPWCIAVQSCLKIQVIHVMSIASYHCLAKHFFITCSDDKQCTYKLMFENKLRLWCCYQTMSGIFLLPLQGNLFEINRHHQVYGLWINMNHIGVQMIFFFSAQRSRWYAQGSSPKWRSLLIYPMVGCMLWSHPRNPWIAITSSLMREVWHIQHCYT